MTTVTISKIGQIGVPVADVNRALSFYRDKLGLTILFHNDNMAFFESGGLRLMLTLPEKEEFAHPSSVIYFEVDHIQEAYDRLVEKGVTFIDSPHIVSKTEQTETWMVFFRDSEQNIHALMSEQPL